jgi:ATP-dependent DNA ligase
MLFYEPMLALATSKPFNGKNWIFEMKWNGFRAIAYVDDYLLFKAATQRNSNMLFLN